MTTWKPISKAVKIAAKIAILSMMVSAVSCYQMKDRQYLNIVFNDSKLNSYFLEKYVDSVRNKNLVIPDSINYAFFLGNKIYENERLIYFNNAPDEWYLISFDAAPCWIVYIYNKQLSENSINERELLGDSEIKRIEIRFRKEILKPAEQYGKLHHLPDSVLYNTKFQ